MVASRLGVAVPSINNVNVIRTVRGLIRSRYMAHSRFLKATFDQGNKCAKCGWMLVRQRTKLQRPELCETPCCGSNEHLGCSVLEICRRCNTHLKVLACVVCHKEIAPPDATADDAYRMALRTPSLNALYIYLHFDILFVLFFGLPSLHRIICSDRDVCCTGVAMCIGRGHGAPMIPPGSTPQYKY